MTREPGRLQCGFFKLGLFVVFLVIAPGMALGALVRSREFLWAAWTLAILIGGWAAFIR